MIETLSISNYALIDRIELNFGDGLNIITGETGAGKSIMLGALSMLLGNRADTRVVSDKNKKSIVEASFDISKYPQIKCLVEECDADWDERQLILRREISPNGRSRSFVNDSPVTLAQLQKIAINLVDIHSQHQNLLLADQNYQLQIIDTLIADKNIKSEYQKLFMEFSNALKKYKVLRKQIETAKDDEEFMRFQLEKLDELNLVEGEQAELENERETLANMEAIKDSLSQLMDIFSAEENVAERLGVATTLLENTASLPDADNLSERTEALRQEALDIAREIERLDDHLEADPERLSEIEERLNDIYSLQRRHNVDTVEQLIEIREKLRESLEKIDNSDEELKNLAVIAKKAKIKATEAASVLSEERKKVASEFATKLIEDASPLGMKNLRVEINVTPSELGSNGADTVNFMFAFNKNQQLMPVKDTASGGEISRLMLVIKSIVARYMQLPSIVFDEIDTGVSGEIAAKMGDLMKEISRHIQVIAITHLPQVAAKGTVHHKVYKQDSETSTNTYISTLTDEQRIDELALMLSGNASNSSARQTAKSLLETK